LLRRLASAPLTRFQVVFGKWAGRMMVALAQIASALLVASLLFTVDWGPDLPMVVVVLIAWGAFATSMGLWLGNLARTEGQVVGLGVLSTMALAALGGCWWPIEITPPWMQSLANLLPTGWAMNALHRLMTFQTGPGGALGYLALILGATLLAGFLAARRFRFA
jgi:ABC-type multidrug transport system permease subunit